MLPALAMAGAQILLLEFAQTILASPLQLNLPTLLDSALLNPINPPIINMSSLGEALCFDPSPSHIPTNYRDCALAASEIARASDTRIYTFGRGSGDGITYKLPKTFESGTCSITLDMVYDDQRDRLTLATIQDAARRLALVCTTGPVFTVGGLSAVGPTRVLYVTILGTMSRTIG